MSTITSQPTVEYSDIVYNVLEVLEPDVEPSRLFVIEQKGEVTPAEEMVDIDGKAMSIAELNTDWPPGFVTEYDVTSDSITRVVFEEEMMKRSGGRLLDKSKEEFVQACERNDIRIYSYPTSQLTLSLDLSKPLTAF